MTRVLAKRAASRTKQWSCPTSLAARNGFQPITALRGFALQKSGGGERSCSPAAAPPNPLQTGAGAAAGFASQSPRGRICTCVDPLRRRRPELLGHAEKKVDLAAGLPPTTRRSKRRMIVISPREEKSGPFTRTCTSISSFAGSRPVSWTMKGKKESRTRVTRAGLRQISCYDVSPPAGRTRRRGRAPPGRSRASA